MWNLIIIASAPIIMILMYIYYRDKHEKEPLHMLFLSTLMGAVAVIPVIIIQFFLSFPASWMSSYLQAGWNAFIVAATTEEFFKFFVIMIFIWRSKHFNEPFDGIVYAVYVSLGFALVENIMYVVQGGTSVALLRALTAVPAHAIFGISMGYYIGMAKYKPESRRKLLSHAVIVPVILHGLYDYIIMANLPLLLTIFIIYVVILYIYGQRKIKYLSKFSKEQLEKQKQEENFNIEGNNENLGFNINDFDDIELTKIQTEIENNEDKPETKRGFDV